MCRVYEGPIFLIFGRVPRSLCPQLVLKYNKILFCFVLIATRLSRMSLSHFRVACHQRGFHVGGVAVCKLWLFRFRVNAIASLPLPLFRLSPFRVACRITVLSP